MLNGKEKNGVKLGEYSLDSDKSDIKALKSKLKDDEECFVIVKGRIGNNNWKIAVTNFRIIFIRKKMFSNEFEEKIIYLKNISKIDSKKGMILSEIKINVEDEEILISDVTTVYLKLFLNTISTQRKENTDSKLECNVKNKVSKKKEEKQYQEERLKQLKRDSIPYCPKCQSTSLTYQNKKLSVGRAVTGAVLFGKEGAILGGLSSKKGEVKCLNCGYKWKLKK